MTIIIFNYLYQLLTDPKNKRCIPKMCKNINTPRNITLLDTMVYCLYSQKIGRPHLVFLSHLMI